jgi:hypothetical protein
MPAEATVDPSALASAVRMVVAGGMADAKLWRPNTVPAIGQLEEGAYGEGVSALADLFDGMVRVLDLPEDPLAKALLPDTMEPAQPESPPEDPTPPVGGDDALLEAFPDDFPSDPEAVEQVWEDLAKALGWRSAPIE